MIRDAFQRFVLIALALLIGRTVGPAQASSEAPKLVVESFTISGTRSIATAELGEITGSMVGSEFQDSSDELKERIRSQFQDHGFLTADIKGLDIKVLDPLASPRPIRLEADVEEGPRCRFSRIEFTGNHLFSSDELRAKFPVKAGEEFRVSKVRSGLESTMRLLRSKGFLDSFVAPDTKIDSSSSVKLAIDVHEGPQYRMGRLEVLGPTEAEDRLKMGWKLSQGAVFNANYIDTFLQKNNSLLPSDFTRYNNGVDLFKDCSDHTVDVHLHLNKDPQHSLADDGKRVDCSSPEETGKK